MSRRGELNSRPLLYESTALPTELLRHKPYQSQLFNKNQIKLTV